MTGPKINDFGANATVSEKLDDAYWQSVSIFKSTHTYKYFLEKVHFILNQRYQDVIISRGTLWNQDILFSITQSPINKYSVFKKN